MEILNWNKLFAIPLILLFYGCGQQTMKDEGLETKSIIEAASSTPTFKHLHHAPSPLISKPTPLSRSTMSLTPTSMGSTLQIPDLLLMH